jgi:hypothetical protein
MIKNIIHLNVAGQPCTYLAQISTSQTGQELTYVQNKYKMVLAMSAAFPYALHIESGRSHFIKEGGPKVYIGTLEIIFTYCGRWDDQASSIDAIWQTMDDDLERLKANLESNDSVQYGNAAFTVSVPSIGVDPYRGSLNTEYPGLTLVERKFTAMAGIAPYDCLT